MECPETVPSKEGSGGPQGKYDHQSHCQSSFLSPRREVCLSVLASLKAASGRRHLGTQVTGFPRTAAGAVVYCSYSTAGVFCFFSQLVLKRRLLRLVMEVKKKR